MKRLQQVILLLLISLQGVYAEVEIETLNSKIFNKTIEDNKMVIVKFSASWCGACKQMQPKYKTVSEKMKSTVLFTEVDVDKEENLSILYEIKSVPTVVLFKNGKEVDRYTGGLNEEEIELFVDPQTVMDRYKSNCSNKDALSCQQLAHLYDNGIATKVNKVLASELYEKACALGQIKSCFNVAYMYDTAEGIKEDNGKALKLYSKACEGEHKIACHNLAIMYEEGEGVKVDGSLAIKLYEKACKLGYGDACYNMALIYEKGKWVEKNLLKAKEFYKLACEDGDDEACKEWKNLSEK